MLPSSGNIQKAVRRRRLTRSSPRRICRTFIPGQPGAGTGWHHKGAKEGQLVDISDKLKDYPNLSKSIAEENVPPALYEKAIDAYDGKNISSPQNQPATNEDGMDWLYGFYVRKDIAEKVGVDPQSVVTKEDFYNFLKNQGCQSAGERPAGLSSGRFQ